MDAFWEGRFEQQFTDDDIMWECCICRQPKVPYVTLVPCGHSLCKNCSTAVAKCPTCRKPVEKRTDGHELTQMVLSRIVYRCTTDGCSFRGTEREARDHICRVYRYRELGPHIPDDEFKTLVLQLPESAPDSDVLDEIQKAELRYNPPSPPVPAALEPPEAVVYWDYDNLPPRGVGATFESFLEGLHDALRANGIVVKHTAAYLVNGKDYGNDLERLGKALVSVQLCGTKREQADRNMSDDMRRRASELGKRGVAQPVGSTCRFLHPAPGVAHLYGLTLDDGAATVQSETPTLAPAAITVVFVDGAETPVEELVDNDALAYLRAHPRSNGRTCNNSSPTHDASKCKYVHRKAPAVTVLVDGIATPG